MPDDLTAAVLAECERLECLKAVDGAQMDTREEAYRLFLALLACVRALAKMDGHLHGCWAVIKGIRCDCGKAERDKALREFAGKEPDATD